MNIASEPAVAAVEPAVGHAVEVIVFYQKSNSKQSVSYLVAIEEAVCKISNKFV